MSTMAYFGTQEDFEIAEDLANNNIIVDRDTIDEYRLTNHVLRQEIIGIGLKLGSIPLPSNYACK